MKMDIKSREWQRSNREVLVMVVILINIIMMVIMIMIMRALISVMIMSIMMTMIDQGSFFC